jgi:hypothetical protein
LFESRSVESQQEFLIETRRLPQAAASTFCSKLDETLKAIGLTAGFVSDPPGTPSRIYERSDR